ncbi:MAG TPA: hypothetical protein VF765_18380 [Polyangiaceae bacterium]
MRASRWAAFGACLALVACGGALAPNGGDGDGGSGGDALPSGSSSGPVSSGSSGSTSSGSSGTPSGSTSGSGSVGPSSSSSSGSGSGGVSVDASFGCGNGAPPPMTGSMVCDDCVEVSCSLTWCTCAGDSSFDDAGLVDGCLGYVHCIIGCVNGDPEAGVPPASLSMCAMLCGSSSTYSAQQQQEGQNLVSCLAASCNTATTCGM